MQSFGSTSRYLIRCCRHPRCFVPVYLVRCCFLTTFLEKTHGFQIHCKLAISVCCSTINALTGNLRIIIGSTEALFAFTSELIIWNRGQRRIVFLHQIFHHQKGFMTVLIRKPCPWESSRWLIWVAEALLAPLVFEICIQCTFRWKVKLRRSLHISSIFHKLI